MGFSSVVSSISSKDSSGEPISWYLLAIVVCAALLLRIALAPGFFGSDETVYLRVALEIANGNWVSSNYIGALRYGINLPNALFIRLLGANEFAANLWSLLCSVGEVALVYIFALRLWGNKAAFLCASLLALLPLHIVSAARVLGDAPLAFFITFSFLLLWLAEERRGALWYFCTGVSIGAVFWIKEVVTIYSGIFIIYMLMRREWNSKWLWILLGVTMMVVVNCLLMWTLAGDPMHVFNIVRTATGNYVRIFNVETSAWFYFNYLFLDIKHLWLVPYVAVAGITLWFVQVRGQRVIDKSNSYIVLWALGLLSIFSFTPISFAPLTLIAKQPNYMLIFVAPLCMLAGYCMAELKGAGLKIAVLLVLAPSAVLGALEQGAVRAFTANSKALDRAMQSQPSTMWIGSTHNANLGELLALIDGRPNQWTSFRETLASPGSERRATQPSEVLAVLDPQTLDWFPGPKPVTGPQPCWSLQGEVAPIGLGIGNQLAGLFANVASAMPLAPADRAAAMLEKLAHPAPARVYRVQAGLDVWCNAR